MSRTEPAIRNISDTAHWAAVYRARETDRPDALFRDPFARRLAGARGEQIFLSLPAKDRAEWAWVARTFLFDQFIAGQIQEGIDMVLNLAAGLDARPYRMTLPASLRWVEVDLPDILDYKENILRDDRPACALERVRMDLSNVGARRALFDQLGRKAKRVLVVTEGLLTYLSGEEVGALARDLAVPASFQRWTLEIVSPGLLRMMQKKVGVELRRASAPFKFGPAEGPEFFVPHGWRPADVRSLLQTARRQRRLPLFLRLVALLPESNGRQGRSPWSAVCLMAKQEN